MHYNTTTRAEDYGVEGIAAPDSVRLARFVCYQVLGVPVSTLGVLGNVISIAVLTRRSMLWGVISTNCYLVALSCSDMLYLLVLNFGVLGTMWQRVSSEHTLEDMSAGAFGNGTDGLTMADAAPWQPHPYVLAAVNVFSNTSIWIVVAFTTERFIAVTYPMRGRVLCNPRRAKWIVMATWAAVLLLHVPNLFELDAETGEETAMAQHPAYRIGYNWGVLVFFFSALPMALLFIFNVLLIRSVAQAAAIRRRMTLGESRRDSSTPGMGIVQGCTLSRSRGTTGGAASWQKADQQRSITVLLIAVVVIFFTLQAPNAFILVKSTYEDYAAQLSGEQLSNTHLSSRQVAAIASNFLTLLSSSINFLLYSALSKKFRQTLFTIVCPCLESCVSSEQRQIASLGLNESEMSTAASMTQKNQKQKLMLSHTYKMAAYHTIANGAGTN